MKPITFECHKMIPKSGEGIFSEIADVSRWSEFGGYGILPGIEKAEYEKRTQEMVGSRIRVRNTDGSSHVEEIYKWLPCKEAGMRFHEFTPPLRSLAAHFTEEWRLKAGNGEGTYVVRRFELYPKRLATRPFLWLISLLFRRAIAQHLDEIAASMTTKQ